MIKEIGKNLNLIDWIWRKIKNIVQFIKENFYRVDLNNLSNYEEKIISKFYDKNIKEYTLGYKTIEENDENEAIIIKLINRNIIQDQNDLEKIENYNGNGVPYKLTHRSYRKLNKKLKKNRDNVKK